MIVDAIRSYLEREGLVLCRAPDTTFALEGAKFEAAAEGLGGAVLEAEWDDAPTTEVKVPSLRVSRGTLPPP